ncbi:MAG: alanine racemase [Trueperaceae bacterium]|nr:alanine racemase [Trueperaceae bacterium]
MTDPDLADLAARFGTPTYVLDLDVVRARLAELRAAFPDAAIRYAAKANALPALLRALADAGVGVEALGAGELRAAAAAGVPGSALLLGGPGQDAAARAAARDLGVALVSLDGRAQAAAWRAEPAPTPRFLVRVHPGLDPATHPHLATGAIGAKFGVAPAVADALARDLAAAGRLAGFHVHAGSMIDDPSLYDDLLARLDPLFDAVPEARVANLGGGFAVPGADLPAIAARVGPWARARDLTLLLEPGRYLVADAGTLLTRVAWRKGPAETGGVTHWICDAGMTHYARHALYGAEPPIREVGTPRGDVATGDVDGPACENADRLGTDRTLAAEAGDLLAVGRAGAYGAAMASTYTASPRPAEAVVEGGVARLARRRETLDDLTARDA